MDIGGKIRIGNDIRLKVGLKNVGQEGSYAHIRFVKCYLVNETAEIARKQKLERETKFISRFPIVNNCPCYSPTEYSVHTCGCAGYYHNPINNVVGDYTGFGVKPNWNRLYPCHRCINPNVYLCHTEYTEVPGVVNCYFPATDQLNCGKYKLVVVAGIYQSGYWPNNIRTITAQYDNVFELVNDSTGTTGNIEIIVGEEAWPIVSDKFVNNGRFVKNIDASAPEDENNLVLTLNSGEQIQISEGSRWYEN